MTLVPMLTSLWSKNTGPSESEICSMQCSPWLLCKIMPLLMLGCIIAA